MVYHFNETWSGGLIIDNIGISRHLLPLLNVLHIVPRTRRRWDLADSMALSMGYGSINTWMHRTPHWFTIVKLVALRTTQSLIYL